MGNLLAGSATHAARTPKAKINLFLFANGFFGNMSFPWLI